MSHSEKSDNNMNSHSTSDLTRTLQHKDSFSINDINDNSYNDQENDASEAQSSQLRRYATNKEYIKFITTKTFDDAKKSER